MGLDELPTQKGALKKSSKVCWALHKDLDLRQASVASCLADTCACGPCTGNVQTGAEKKHADESGTRPNALIVDATDVTDVRVNSQWLHCKYAL